MVDHCLDAGAPCRAKDLKDPVLGAGHVRHGFGNLYFPYLEFLHIVGKVSRKRLGQIMIVDTGGDALFRGPLSSADEVIIIVGFCFPVGCTLRDVLFVTRYDVKVNGSGVIHHLAERCYGTVAPNIDYISASCIVSPSEVFNCLIGIFSLRIKHPASEDHLIYPV